MLENFPAVKLCIEQQSTLRAPPALPVPAHPKATTPHQPRQPQPQQGHSRAWLQLPTALPHCRLTSQPGLDLSLSPGRCLVSGLGLPQCSQCPAPGGPGGWDRLPGPALTDPRAALTPTGCTDTFSAVARNLPSKQICSLLIPSAAVIPVTNAHQGVWSYYFISVLQ